MVGQGEFAELLAQRFPQAEKRFGLDKPWPELDCSRFVRPSLSGSGETLLAPYCAPAPSRRGRYSIGASGRDIQPASCARLAA
jgi:hypothetical protein